ncbi:MAG: hypothetical protein RJA57_303 [Bacteroidota bacterium]
MKRILLILLFTPALVPVCSQTSSLKIGPLVDSADFFLQKGLVEKQNGRRLESMKNFEKAAKYDANSRSITEELALAYKDLRRYNLALEAYKKLLSLGGESVLVYQQLVGLSYQMRSGEDVLRYAAKLKAADPAAKVAFYVGRVHYDAENYGDAIQSFLIAEKEDSLNAEVPYLIARSYADMMNYKLAIPYFKKAIALKPAENYWLYELGLIYYAMNNDAEALKYILEAGEKGYKRDNDYLENLAIAYLNVGQLDKGVEMLNEILKRKPSDLNILGMVAEAYYGKGKFDQAMEYWDRMLEYDKENASALYMIGMCYQKKGGRENMEKGTRLCDKAIEMDPSLASLKQKKMMAGL